MEVIEKYWNLFILGLVGGRELRKFIFNPEDYSEYITKEWYKFCKPFLDDDVN